MQRLSFLLAGFAGAGAVLLAAMAAHAGHMERDVLQAVAMILGWQAPALLALAIWNRGAGHVAAALIGLGAALFAVAVLLAGPLGISFGPMAPTGGVLMIAGWIWVAGLALRPSR